MKDLLEGNPNADTSAVANSVHDPAIGVDLLRRSPAPLHSRHGSEGVGDNGTANSEGDATDKDTPYVGSAAEDESESSGDEYGKKRKGKSRGGTPGPKRMKKEGSVVPYQRDAKVARKAGGALDEITAILNATTEANAATEERRMAERKERDQAKQDAALKALALKLEVDKLRLVEQKEARLAAERQEELNRIERQEQRAHELAIAKIKAGLTKSE